MDLLEDFTKQRSIVHLNKGIKKNLPLLNSQHINLKSFHPLYDFIYTNAHTYICHMSSLD
jgi:hypothetical protein